MSTNNYPTLPEPLEIRWPDLNAHALAGAAEPAPPSVAPNARSSSEHGSERLHTFLNAAAGDGLVLDDVDAADLYVELFPERYAAAIAGITTPTEAK